MAENKGFAENKGVVSPPHDLNAKWDACLDLTLRRFVYSSLAGAFGGLLFFSNINSSSLFFSLLISILLYFPTLHMPDFKHWNYFFSTISFSRYSFLKFGIACHSIASTNCSDFFISRQDRVRCILEYLDFLDLC